MKTKECVGCGFCCTKAKCGAGQRLYPAADICPALVWNGERHTCDLMELPGELGREYRKQLYAGEGCCAGLNSWRNEPLQNRTLIDAKQLSYKSRIPPIMQKFLKALGSEMISGDKLQLMIGSFCRTLQKDGMGEDEAKVICNECIDKINSHRSRFTREFMG